MLPTNGPLSASLLSPGGSRETTFLADYATVNLADELKRLPGVGDVVIFGSGYSMRVWLHPDRMARLNGVPPPTTPQDTSDGLRPADRIA